MILEIRTYRLKPGTRDGFVDTMRSQAAPLLKEFGIDVVSCGPSLVEEAEAYLARAFASLEERERLEDAFYTSDAWRDGPREAIVTPIEHYHTIVLDLPKEAIDAMRS